MTAVPKGQVLAASVGELNDDLTMVVDLLFGSEWARSEEILAILALRHDPGSSSRELAVRSGMGRRGLSRVVRRLAAEHIVKCERTAADRRVISIELTAVGHDRFETLADAVQDVFLRYRDAANDIWSPLVADVHSSQRAVAEDSLAMFERLASVNVHVEKLAATADSRPLDGRQRSALVRIVAGRCSRPVDLAGPLGVGRSGVTALVDQLVAKGLVGRSRRGIPGDRRAVRLVPSDAGRLWVDGYELSLRRAGKRLAPIFFAIRDLAPALGSRIDVVPAEEDDRAASDGPWT